MESNGLATAGLASKQAEELVILDARFRDLVSALMLGVAYWPGGAKQQMDELNEIRDIVVGAQERLASFGRAIVPKPEEARVGVGSR